MNLGPDVTVVTSYALCISVYVVCSCNGMVLLSKYKNKLNKTVYASVVVELPKIMHLMRISRFYMIQTESCEANVLKILAEATAIKTSMS